MGSFGDRLKREREMRGITVEEIAEATKIGTRALRALEAEEFDKLPGGVFNKGFVRAYSRYLGIDEEQAVADYLAALADAQAAARAQASEAVPPAGFVEPPPPPSSGGGLAFILVLLLLAGLGLGGWKYYMRRKNPTPTRVQATSPPAPTVVEAKDEPPKPAPAATAPMPITTASDSSSQPSLAPKQQLPVAKPAAADLPKPAAAATPGFTVGIRATEDAWVSVNSDGKTIIEEVLHPSTEKTLRAQQQLSIRTGNAGGLEVSFNGKPLGVLGDSKQVRTLIFTSDGMQTPP